MKLKHILIVLVISAVTLTATPAFSNPVEDKRRKAAQIAAQIETNGGRISELAEKYNETRIKLDNVRSSIEEAQKQLQVAKEQNEVVRKRVQQRAVLLYTQSSTNTKDTQQHIDRNRKEKYADVVTGRDDSILRDLTITTETVSERKAQLDEQLKAVEEQERALDKQKKEIEKANAEQQRLLNQTRGELATLVRQQQSRNETRRTQTSSPARNSNASLPGNLPAPSPKAATAIEYARQQLGKPYRYAASGPNSFDCSGLTMRAWGAAGVSMPHFSGAQYAMFPKVPLNALQPGDLVYRPGHIGLYIGNGLMIHAPQTGDVVKIAPTGRLTGASRPG